MIKYVTVSNSRFHFPAMEIGTPIPGRDSAAYKMARVSERSHARMLRFDWLIRRVGSCVASIRMCAREGEPWARDPLASPHTVPVRVRTRAIIGFSSVCYPLSRPFEMADMAIPRESIIPRDSFVVTTIIALFGESNRAFSIDCRTLRITMAIRSVRALYHDKT